MRELSTDDGLMVSRTDEPFEVVMADESAAALLECEPGVPFLLLVSVLSGSSGRVCECTKLVTRGA